MESPNKSNLLKFYNFTKDKKLQLVRTYDKEIEVVMKIFEYNNNLYIVEPFCVLIY